jgi:hypothetical protein
MTHLRLAIQVIYSILAFRLELYKQLSYISFGLQTDEAQLYTMKRIPTAFTEHSNEDECYHRSMQNNDDRLGRKMQKRYRTRV